MTKVEAYRTALRVIERGRHAPLVMGPIVFTGVYRLGAAVVARVPRDPDTICLLVNGKKVKLFGPETAIAAAFRRRRKAA